MSADSIIIAVTAATVNYIACSTDSEVVGFAEISGDATIHRFSNSTFQSPQALFVSLVIQGRPALQVKHEATVWPPAFDEVTSTGGIIGIVCGQNEFSGREGYVFLHPAQFERLVSLIGPSNTIRVTLYLRQSTQPKFDLIERVDFGATVIERKP